MYKPKYNGFPPVHLNLGLYQDLLKNFPFNSGEEYQAFLNATTSQSQTSTVNSNTTDQSPPLSSTFANTADHQKGFWRNWSFAARKSYKVNPPTRRARATHQTKRETCSVEMDHIFEPRSTGTPGTAGTAGNGPRSNNRTTTPPPPSLPTSIVNEHAQIGVDSNLDEIRVVAADEENVP